MCSLIKIIETSPIIFACFFYFLRVSFLMWIMGIGLCHDILNCNCGQKSLIFGIVCRKFLVFQGIKSEANVKLY